MSRGFYRRIALSNLKNNHQIEVPYFLSCILMVAMHYIISLLANNPGLQNMYGGDGLMQVLPLACWVTRIFVVVFLFYTNTFLMKQRQKEFGVYHVLGMEKRHLSITLLWEYVLLLIGSLVAGLVGGILFDKVIYLVLLRLLQQPIELGFYISIRGVLGTIMFFILLFLVIFLYNSTQIHIAKPMELLRGGNVGEREPKAKWLLAVIGLLCLGYGYSISLTTKNALESITSFFSAVVMVILGTYLLFTAGSIALIKLLKKNKRYYYQTRHFVSVSGMMYRMKQNAIGLAHICILSTMVLVMVSTTASLIVSFEDTFSSLFPRQLIVITQRQPEKELDTQIAQIAQEENTEPEHTLHWENPYYPISISKKNSMFVLKTDSNMQENDAYLGLYSAKDYAEMTGIQLKLEKGQALLSADFVGIENLHEITITNQIEQRSYAVVGSAEKLINASVSLSNNLSCYLVVDSQAEVERLQGMQTAISPAIVEYYCFDVPIDDTAQIALEHELASRLDKFGYTNLRVGSRAESRSYGLALYGGLFFVGIFLGILFMVITVLIIYYKQIAEGYDDRRRFAIMQQVGMTKKEVADAIGSQILTVFFLPLITAGVHLVFAFPIIRKMLELLQMTNTALYIKSMVICYIAFAGFYGIVYRATARTYRKIVEQ